MVSKLVSPTRLATVDAVEWKQNCNMTHAMATLETLPGNRNRAKDDAMGNSDDLPAPQRGRRVRELHLALVADEAIVEERAHWREPGIRARRDATHASAAE